ncbi:MAG: stage 0 sporulation family protein [Pygmaiobacter sp.]|nr:stage 0 sporulation family protein [Pygmaiobacter sp.]
MAEVIGVRFKDVGKVYYFDPDHTVLKKGDMVIVETARGIECGEVAMENREIEDEGIVYPLKKMIRKATEADLKKVEENRQKEKSAFDICMKKISEHKLDMKLVEVEYTFDNNKILFYFTADGRVDFRELVKDLASVFRTRIELRQIGVRDEAKMLGGLGICGKPFCCSTFLGEFQPVSIKMAKEQGLSLNPTKISGTCGRLMCCLKYEQVAYTDLLKTTPKVGAIVSTPEGKGVVVDQNLLTGVLKVRMDRAPEAAPMTFQVKQVKLLKDAQIRLAKEEIEKLKDLEDK